ncbi:MAG: leucine-rich repeat domain-containing protein [Clostridia bacterium]|nr:leucine-rich repeat domain-containing protein [Clostridia bacterium]
MGNDAFKGATNITGVTIPNSVKNIWGYAFQNCTNLKKVELGSVEYISGNAFNGCTELESIKIPKTLKGTDSFESISKAVFSGCTKLTQITLEEGLTIIPHKLCAETPITEITIPNTVTNIWNKAFQNCTELKKITILDNVTKMEDKIFENHNEDLTIYCYKDSTAHQYAIKNNIKYILLTRPVDQAQNISNIEKGVESEKSSGIEETTVSKKQDSTTASGKLPNTGVDMKIIAIITIITIAGIITLFKYKKIKDI